MFIYTVALRCHAVLPADNQAHSGVEPLYYLSKGAYAALCGDKSRYLPLHERQPHILLYFLLLPYMQMSRNSHLACIACVCLLLSILTVQLTEHLDSITKYSVTGDHATGLSNS